MDALFRSDIVLFTAAALAWAVAIAVLIAVEHKMPIRDNRVEKALRRHVEAKQ